MSLKEFEFIDKSVDILAEMSPMLADISDDIEEYLEKILKEKEQEYISISSRVKSESSLREKIIRNRYLIKFDTADEMMEFLPDLIGLRIECKFIEEENKIYRLLRRYFNRTDDKVYYYNKENKNIQLKLSERQPSKQKNGFEIYKIDGIYKILNRNINFELQIKSLVNVFWGEIEHKIIYKNNTYLLADGFIKNLMVTIKQNLTMIDQQLLSLYKTFHAQRGFNEYTSRKEIEKLFAKFVYDIFSQKMLDNIGFIVDFKKACETIINYSLNKIESDDKIGQFVLREFSRLTEIVSKDIDFNNEIEFETEPEFKDEFSKRIGGLFRERLNTEFPWNLFFRILFEIEPYKNRKDFENFVYYIKETVLDRKMRESIIEKFGEEDGNSIIHEIYTEVANLFEDINGVEILYKQNLEKIAVITSDVMYFTVENYENCIEYEAGRAELFAKFTERLEDIFD
ncbi:GTP pyrophosphokinase [Peptacetobacter hominis]|uniref:GTP pyrophosphokinase n=1 Tax=Peptacetobacter hominis TaxID=2743610 RepID=A0A544QWH2_9FIRM|nr:GTP pyrophosphokinase [Peptacetobacter hominis]TQQ85041.1 GTP pyrophosphokinase [Peptacetobacter hominis]